MDKTSPCNAVLQMVNEIFGHKHRELLRRSKGLLLHWFLVLMGA